MRLGKIADGAFLGFAIGFFSTVPVSLLFGVPLQGPPVLVCAALGAALGGWVAWLGGPVARWCAGMALAVGGVAFAVGFFGPMIFEPGANQGPLLGIFFTGP